MARIYKTMRRDMATFNQQRDTSAQCAADLSAKCARLTAALKKYGKHHSHCEYMTRLNMCDDDGWMRPRVSSSHCTCDLTAALEGGE